GGHARALPSARRAAVVSAAAGVSPTALAFAGACLAVLGALECCRASAPALAARAPRVAGAVAAVAGTVIAAGREGRDPGTAERRRLLAAGAGIAFVGGAVAAGMLEGLVLATAGPWAASRVLRLQRRAGGDLARLLRETALALEDQARLEQEVRAATAQARFTGLLVVLLPLGGALLAELASPGYLKGLAGSFLTAWLGGLALAMQAVA